jgi:hypothetical protein
MRGPLGAREGGGLKMALIQRVPFVSGGELERWRKCAGGLDIISRLPHTVFTNCIYVER